MDRGWSHLDILELHALQGLGEEDVEATATVNKYPRHLDSTDDQSYHQWVSTRFWQVGPVVTL